MAILDLTNLLPAVTNTPDSGTKLETSEPSLQELVEKPSLVPLRSKPPLTAKKLTPTPLTPTTEPAPKPDYVEQVDVSPVQTQLTLLQDALQQTPMGDVKGHMLVLQNELRSTEYLVDMLQPTDIGLLVKAQRAIMQEDILLNSATKKKAKAKPRGKINNNLTADAFSLDGL